MSGHVFVCLEVSGFDSCTKTGKWAVMYLCVRGIEFAYFFVFFYWILELFLQCGQVMKNYFVLSHLTMGKWNKIITFPMRPEKRAEFSRWVWGYVTPRTYILEYFMQNPAFWVYLKGFWCLKLNMLFFFVLLFIINFRYESE